MTVKNEIVYDKKPDKLTGNWNEQCQLNLKYAIEKGRRRGHNYNKANNRKNTQRQNEITK